MKTDMGELTVTTDCFLVGASSASDKYHGLQNVEQIYRQRYLDLISNDDSLFS